MNLAALLHSQVLGGRELLIRIISKYHQQISSENIIRKLNHYHNR